MIWQTWALCWQQSCFAFSGFAHLRSSIWACVSLSLFWASSSAFWVICKASWVVLYSTFLSCKTIHICSRDETWKFLKQYTQITLVKSLAQETSHTQTYKSRLANMFDLKWCQTDIGLVENWSCWRKLSKSGVKVLHESSYHIGYTIVSGLPDSNFCWLIQGKSPNSHPHDRLFNPHH